MNAALETVRVKKHLNQHLVIASRLISKQIHQAVIFTQ